MDRAQAKRLIIETFENAFDKEKFTYFLKNLLKSYEEKSFIYSGNYIPDAFKPHINSLERIGKYTCDDKEIDLLIVHLKKETSLERARTMQRNFIAWYLKGSRGGKLKDAALVAFVSPEQEDWRFSLVKMDYRFEEKPSGKVKVIEEFTPARRWSFLVGKNEKSHTAQSRFLPILEDDNLRPTLEDLEEAFNVEVVTKEFFEKYRYLFTLTKSKLDKVVKKNTKVKQEFENKKINTVDFAKKLLGQIIFLYFLQKKGWFGVERGKPWGTGSKDFIRRLFKGEYGKYQNFYDEILEPLFYEALRTDRTAQDHYYSRFNCKIPFLNGGLFDPINNFDWVNTDILLPDKLFSNTRRTKTRRTKEGDNGILDIFDRYNFTVNEEEPLEKEVALDPELLGKIYEKLNAIRPDNFDEYVNILKSGKKGEETKFNKEYGVYYTPREIVHYMCQESLKNYLEEELKGKVPKEDIEKFVKIADSVLEKELAAFEREQRIKEGIQKTTIYESEIPDTIKQNAKEIDKLLANIKVCDPAVGSGVFLVGMMQEIVKLRQLLSVYLGKQVKVYDLKRHCIENSLYGVDIDPGAIEICKLRFWLSLIVDEEDFQNIKPLPNLDYKVVCGDSLLEVEKDLFNRDDFSKLEKLKQEYFNETNSNRKQKLKKNIDDLIFKITKRHKKFDFEVYFSEVFQQKGGFDLVIENPPYVRQERIKNYKPLLQKANYEVFNSTSDLYTYFYEKSYKIAKPGGHVCMITSNKWMRAKYGEKLRNLLKNKTMLKQIIDFNGYAIFEATVDTNIILFQKLKPQETNKFKAVTVDSTFEITKIEQYLKEKSIQMEQSKLDDKTFVLADDRTLALKQKIEEIGKPLKDWDVKIYRGVITGFNEAFIIDTETKDRILKNCKDEDERKRTKEILKPILRGRDIGRYYYRWAGLWLIKIESGWTNKNRGKNKPEEFFKMMFPALYNHLISFANLKTEETRRKGLLNRDDQGDYWWELRDCDYYPEFEKEKIVWQEMSQEPSFAYDRDSYFTNQTAYIATGKLLKYIIGILNSNVSHFYLLRIAYSLSNQANRWIKQYVEQIPLPTITPQNQHIAKKIESLVSKILSITQSDDYLSNSQKQEKVKELENEINKLVFELYDLTPEEIKIIKSEIEK